MENLTIKGLKTWATHDGGGYQFNLYEGKKKVLFVHNDGNGGCLDIQSLDDGDFLKRLNAYCEAQPPQVLQYEGLPDMTIEMTPEIFLEDLVSDYEKAKQLAKAKKKGIVFRPTGESERSFQILNTLDLAVAKAYLDKEHPKGYQIL